MHTFPAYLWRAEIYGLLRPFLPRGIAFVPKARGRFTFPRVAAHAQLDRVLKRREFQPLTVRNKYLPLSLLSTTAPSN